jgi:uncharacterized protein YoxC
MLADFAASDAAYLALAIFLVVVGVTLGYAFVRLGGTFGRLSSLIRGTEREALPVVTKVGGSVDRVNRELDKLDQAADSAVDAVDAVDQAVRTVSFAVKRPIQKLVGLSAGVSHGFATLRAKRDVNAAMASAKEAAARREADLEEELRRARA